MQRRSFWHISICRLLPVTSFKNISEVTLPEDGLFFTALLALPAVEAFDEDQATLQANSPLPVTRVTCDAGLLTRRTPPAPPGAELGAGPVFFLAKKDMSLGWRWRGIEMIDGPHLGGPEPRIV